MSHSCKALLVHCIDFRLGPELKSYISSQNLLGDCDVVSVAGAAQNIASPVKETDREFMMRQIDISKRLHHISEIFLINHTDCGAYGGSGAFASPQDETEKHRQELVDAKAYIEKTYPDIRVHTLLARIDTNGKVAIAQI